MTRVGDCLTPYRPAGVCDDEIAACYCNGTYGRINAPLDAPPGAYELLLMHYVPDSIVMRLAATLCVCVHLAHHAAGQFKILRLVRTGSPSPIPASTCCCWLVFIQSLLRAGTPPIREGRPMLLHLRPLLVRRPPSLPTLCSVHCQPAVQST